MKATVHGAIGILALVVTTYSLAAWKARRAPQSMVNAFLFGGLTLYEVWNTADHLGGSNGRTDAL